MNVKSTKPNTKNKEYNLQSRSNEAKDDEVGKTVNQKLCKADNELTGTRMLDQELCASCRVEMKQRKQS